MDANGGGRCSGGSRKRNSQFGSYGDEEVRRKDPGGFGDLFPSHSYCGCVSFIGGYSDLRDGGNGIAEVPGRPVIDQPEGKKRTGVLRQGGQEKVRNGNKRIGDFNLIVDRHLMEDKICRAISGLQSASNE